MKNLIRTFVIFDFPPFALIVIILPVHVLWYGEEGLLLLPFNTLNNGCDELFQEAINAQQGGPEVMEEVDQQPLDMRPVMILICHDHQVAVAQL
jgi:hypothetical protein